MNEESKQENALKDDTKGIYDSKISGTDGQAESTSVKKIDSADDDRDPSNTSYSAA